jgi:hypothetical protein
MSWDVFAKESINAKMVEKKGNWNFLQRSEVQLNPQADVYTSRVGGGIDVMEKCRRWEELEIRSL